MIDVAIPLAHLGHWYYWPIYLAPVIVVLVAAARTYARQRRESATGSR